MADLIEKEIIADESLVCAEEVAAIEKPDTLHDESCSDGEIDSDEETEDEEEAAEEMKDFLVESDDEGDESDKTNDDDGEKIHDDGMIEDDAKDAATVWEEEEKQKEDFVINFIKGADVKHLARLCKDILEVNPNTMEATGTLTKSGKPAKKRVPWSKEKLIDCLLQELEHSHYDSGDTLRTHIVTAYYHTSNKTDVARQRRGADVTTLSVLPRGSKRKAAQGAIRKMKNTIAAFEDSDDEDEALEGGVASPEQDKGTKRRRVDEVESEDEWNPDGESSSESESEGSDDDDYDPDE